MTDLVDKGVLQPQGRCSLYLLYEYKKIRILTPKEPQNETEANDMGPLARALLALLASLVQKYKY